MEDVQPVAKKWCRHSEPANYGLIAIIYNVEHVLYKPPRAYYWRQCFKTSNTVVE